MNELPVRFFVIPYIDFCNWNAVGLTYYVYHYTFSAGLITSKSTSVWRIMMQGSLIIEAVLKEVLSFSSEFTLSEVKLLLLRRASNVHCKLRLILILYIDVVT